MAIAFDNVTEDIYNGYRAGPVSPSWSHTTGSGSNRLLVLTASIWQDTPGTGTITAASYNSVSLTDPAISIRSAGMLTDIWYLVAPATGSNTMSVTVTGATDAVKLSVSTYTGIDPTTPVASNGNATEYSEDLSADIITTYDNSLIVGAVTRFGTTNATPDTFTNLMNDTTGSIFASSDYYLAGSANTYTNSYTGTVSADWSMLLVEFVEKQGGGPRAFVPNAFMFGL